MNRKVCEYENTRKFVPVKSYTRENLSPWNRHESFLRSMRYHLAHFAIFLQYKPISRNTMLTSIILLLVATTAKVHCCFNQWNVSFQTPLTDDTGLPTVQLNDPEVAMKIASALQEWGFSYVTEHDVPDDVINDAQKESKKFFDLPTRVKR